MVQERRQKDRFFGFVFAVIAGTLLFVLIGMLAWQAVADLSAIGRVAQDPGQAVAIAESQAVLERHLLLRWLLLGLGIAALLAIVVSAALSRRKGQALIQALSELRRVNRESALRNVALSEATQAKSRFIAAAAHDLRQPLHALGLFVGALRRRAQVDNDLTEISANIGAASQSMMRMFNSLLDVSRVDSGGVEPKLRTVAVKDMLAPLAVEYGAQAAERGLTFSWVRCSLSVRTDPVLLETILRNFLSNALKYTENGEILLGCRRMGPNLAITVYDTGPGLTSEQLPRAFAEFERLERRVQSAEAGLGLGLSIVRRLADLLAAPVIARSRPGRGSCFGIVLPRVAAEAAPAASDQARPVPPMGSRQVLVVHDDPAELAAIGRSLLARGYVPRLAPSARSAYRLLNPVPDFLLLDLGGDEDAALQVGAEITDRLGIALPTVVVGRGADAATIDRLAAAGFAFLPRPIDVDRLAELLDSLVWDEASDDDEED